MFPCSHHQFTEEVNVLQDGWGLLSLWLNFANGITTHGTEERQTLLGRAGCSSLCINISELTCNAIYELCGSAALNESA